VEWTIDFERHFLFECERLVEFEHAQSAGHRLFAHAINHTPRHSTDRLLLLLFGLETRFLAPELVAAQRSVDGGHTAAVRKVTAAVAHLTVVLRRLVEPERVVAHTCPNTTTHTFRFSKLVIRSRELQRRSTERELQVQKPPSLPPSSLSLSLSLPLSVFHQSMSKIHTVAKRLDGLGIAHLCANRRTGLQEGRHTATKSHGQRSHGQEGEGRKEGASKHVPPSCD
jgi:hypothetical protein